MFSAKKLLLIGFIVVILIAIPITVFLLQQQQELRSRAAASSILSFTPTSTASNPIQVKNGDAADLDIFIDPGSNLVSFIKLELQYDSQKLATVGAGPNGEVFEKNADAFPENRGVPKFEDGKVTITVATGDDTNKVIRTKTKVGTLHLKAIAKTDTPTQVIFGGQTLALSTAGPSTGSNDTFSENVLLLSSLLPAIINVVEPVAPTDEPTPSDIPEPTDVTPSETANQIPVCTILTASVSSGSAPLDVTFTATGSDPDGTVEKISFNFGDSSVTTITEGLGTSSASATTVHSYTSGGTFTASAVITDDSDATSTTVCSQQIEIEGPATTTTITATTSPTVTTTADSTDTSADTPTPTIEEAGPGATIIGMGAFFTVLSVIGAILFFAL
ncbi:MAG: PKD domain-containing protein [Candidatus Levybacteria bacterium]|nr:PKD domain-containing protein [Candidatus Levybacteria bacterium]